MKTWQWFALFTTLFVSLTSAASLPIINPGFEDISSESPYNEFTFGPLTGWDLYDPDSITEGGDGPNFYLGTLRPFFDSTLNAFRNFPAGAAGGIRVGIAFNNASTGDSGEYGYQQLLASSKLQPNTRYTLKVDIGNIASGESIDGNFFNLNGFPGYRIELRAGDALLKSDNNSLFGKIPEGEFRTGTVIFETGPTHAQLGSVISIRLVNLNKIDPVEPAADLEVDFDNVRLETQPASAKPTVTLTAADPKANERGGSGAFQIRRSGSTKLGLIVLYSVVGTAKNGIDYVKLSGQITIPKGKAAAKIMINPIADQRQETAESVVLKVLSSGKYQVGEMKSATVTIVE